MKEEPKTVGVTFISRSKSWRYLRCHHVDILADDAPIQLGEAKHEGQSHSSHVIEFVYIENAPFTLVKKMAEATKVEVRICNDEFTLFSEEMKDLQDFVKLLTPSN